MSDVKGHITTIYHGFMGVPSSRSISANVSYARFAIPTDLIRRLCISLTQIPTMVKFQLHNYPKAERGICFITSTGYVSITDTVSNTHKAFPNNIT